MCPCGGIPRSVKRCCRCLLGPKSKRTKCASDLTRLARASAGTAAGTCIEYTIDTLLVHLDDPALSVQQAVLTVMKAACGVAAPVVGRKASAERGRHRSPAFIDEVIKAANAATS